MTGAPEGELVLAGLFLAPSPERLAALRAAAGGVDWTAALALLESHGVLGLAARNLALSGVELPPGPARALEARLAVLRELELAFRLTLERFLAEAARDRIDVVLLKGAALGLGLYREGGRAQADLDLLVRRREVRRAVTAGARAGLFPAPIALPLWWQLLAHFHAKLTPEPALLREVELHWALGHVALLHTVTTEELFSRARPVQVGQVRARVLDPPDQLLHLCTHLARHFAHAPGHADRAYLVDAARTPGHPLRLKWVLDVRALVEAGWRELDPRELAGRARAWNAAGELSWALGWVRAGLGLLPEAEGWALQVLELSRAPVRPAALSAGAPGSTPELRPLPLVHFRLAALARYPRWLFPPRSFFERGPVRTPLALRRAAHALGVLGHTGLAMAAFPAALLGAALARPGRRRARSSFHEPGRVLELVAAQRALRAGGGGQ